MWCAVNVSVFIRISANSYCPYAASRLHHIRPFGAPSPQGEGFSLDSQQLYKLKFCGRTQFAPTAESIPGKKNRVTIQENPVRNWLSALRIDTGLGQDA